MIDFIKILDPETELERKILIDPIFIKGVQYGRSRPGHPEGQIIFHIRDIFRNIDNCKYVNPEERRKLRLIALFHDTCKFQVNYDLPRVGDNHHGYLARKFAEKYITDEDILQIIDHHDDAYNIWKRSSKRNEWDKGEKDLLKLVDKINDINLYSWFYFCDNSTGNKSQGDYEWFLNITA
jgi:hypothetical protein